MPYISNKRINKIRSLASIHAKALADSKKTDLSEEYSSSELEFIQHYHRGGLDSAVIALQAVTSNRLGFMYHLRGLRDKIYPY